MMLIQEVMTSAPTCCTSSDTLDRVAKLMLEHDCGIIPVCEGRKVVGVITDRDITCRAVSGGKIPAAVPVRDVMTRTVHTVRQDEDLQTAIDLMEAKQVRRLPVLDDDDNIVGIIARQTSHRLSRRRTSRTFSWRSRTGVGDLSLFL